MTHVTKSLLHYMASRMPDMRVHVILSSLIKVQKAYLYGYQAIQKQASRIQANQQNYLQGS